MTLRGDNDIFSLMDEMSSQQGYQVASTSPSSQHQVSTALQVQLVPQVKDYPSIKYVGSREIWNPYPKVKSANEAILLAPSNHQVEVFRRRAYERFKEEFREMFHRANGNSNKEGPSNLWKELSVSSLLERWHFDAKLHEYLNRTTSKTSACKVSGLWTTAQVQGFILNAKSKNTWIDPILISNRSPAGFVDELKFEWTRAWRRKCGSKTRDNEVQCIFTSKKFRKKSKTLSRSIQEVSAIVETKMMEEIQKRAAIETTQQRGKKQMLPKLTGHDDEIKVSFSGLIFTINKQHYHKLQVMYDRQNQHSLNREDHEAGFISALFALLARYDMLQGAGLQSALQGSVFDYLLQEFDCTMECFASPLNCRYERFCSAFPDTDAAFGSLGSFFDYDFSNGGCYQANPPFVANFILAMYHRMEEYLAKASSPLMFVVFVPAWSETSGWKALEGSSYLGHCEIMSQESHYYAEGTQHRRKDRFRMASFDTSVFFLQNEAAKINWPIMEQRVAKLREAFLHHPDKEEIMINDVKESMVIQHPSVETSESLMAKYDQKEQKGGIEKKRKAVVTKQSQQLSILESITKHKKSKKGVS